MLFNRIPNNKKLLLLLLLFNKMTITPTIIETSTMAMTIIITTIVTTTIINSIRTTSTGSIKTSITIVTTIIIITIRARKSIVMQVQAQNLLITRIRKNFNSISTMSRSIRAMASVTIEIVGATSMKKPSQIIKIEMSLMRDSFMPVIKIMVIITITKGDKEITTATTTSSEEVAIIMASTILTTISSITIKIAMASTIIVMEMVIVAVMAITTVTIIISSSIHLIITMAADTSISIKITTVKSTTTHPSQVKDRNGDCS